MLDNAVAKSARSRFRAYKMLNERDCTCRSLPAGARWRGLNIGSPAPSDC
jgi:hypothetical protein